LTKEALAQKAGDKFPPPVSNRGDDGELHLRAAWPRLDTASDNW